MPSYEGRTADHPISDIFLKRWSPRAYTGEAMPVEDLMTILEAARWAPSSYNSQPWIFLYARRDTPQWEQFLGFLGEFNQSWAKNAAVLVVHASSSLMQVPGQEKPVPSHSHSYDAGASWAYLALQASMMGWDAHGMVGFDMQRAFADLNLPQGYRVESAIAIGRRGDKSMLPEQLQGRETPSPRKPLSASVREGAFTPD